MPFRAVDLLCPTCATALEARDVEGHAGMVCATCTGVWFERPTFFTLLMVHRPDAVRELMVHNDGTPRRACPACRQPMEIAWMDFLQLDQCEQHGIWFDPNELDRALTNDTGAKDILKMVKLSEALRNAAKS